ncbi:MAG TPA: type II secretion system protein [Pyrinomonadaceae bacterium]
MKVPVTQRQRKWQRRQTRSGCARGFTLIELIMTLTVLTVMTLGVIPLIKVSVKRQREQRLREELRMMRTAIDQFHREAIAGVRLQGQGQQPQQGQQGPQQQAFVDPRVRVAITDQLIFNSDNPDRYPPDIETLVNGVSVTPIPGAAGTGGGGIVGLSGSDQKATDNTLTSTKKKVYLRAIPIDPVTGKSDWQFRSTYNTPEDSSWDGINIFDVHSSSDETALDGTKYNEW